MCFWLQEYDHGVPVLALGHRSNYHRHSLGKSTSPTKWLKRLKNEPRGVWTRVLLQVSFSSSLHPFPLQLRQHLQPLDQVLHFSPAVIR